MAMWAWRRSWAVWCVALMLGVWGCSEEGDADGGDATSTNSATTGSTNADTSQNNAVTSGDAGGVDADDGGGDDAGDDVGEPDVGPTVETLEVLDDVRITSHSDQPNFQNARGEVDWGEGPFARVTMIVELDTTCYPFDRWADDPPPEGHNWPPMCDAFDRNFEMTLHDPSDPEAVPFELVRAITPFGGPMRIEQDITDLANVVSGPRELNVHITTWSDGAGQVSGSNGGWNVSARFEVERGASPRNVLAAIPLINHSHGSDTEVEDIAFTLPEGTVDTRLEYRATGHGGARDRDSGDCIGGAEEFCERDHKFYFDGRFHVSKTLWRDTCEPLCTLTESRLGTNVIEHCAENPCGALQSVRAPRANWCPGAVTDAEAFRKLDTPGEHSFRYEIKDVYPGGSWRISAMIYAYGE